MSSLYKLYTNPLAAIQAPVHAPQMHPRDRQLLRPLSTLGKPKVAENSVSFLRRTEYISNTGAKAHSSPMRPNGKNVTKRPPKRKSPESDVGTPAYVKRKIEKGFAVTQENLRNTSKIRHPQSTDKNKNLRVVETFPLLPDNNALPDTGAYVQIKYTHAPALGKNGSFDTRLLSTFLSPVEKTEEQNAAYQAMVEAYELSPEKIAKPNHGIEYDLYMAGSQKSAQQFRERFSVNNPKHDDDSLYTARDSDGKPCFPFSRIRTYVTKDEIELDHATKYTDSVFLTFGEDAASSKRAVAWYYPIMSLNKIEPPREQQINKSMNGGRNEGEERQIIDELEVTVEDPIPEVQMMLDHFREKPTEPIDHGSDEAEAEEEEDLPAAFGNGGGREGSGEPGEPDVTGSLHQSVEAPPTPESDAEGDDE